MGAVLSQRSSVTIASSSPGQARSNETQVRTVVTTVEDAPRSEVSTMLSAPPLVADAPQSVTAQAPTAAANPAAPAPAPAPVPHVATSCPGNPDALGVSRVVEIDTTGGPGFGFEHFKAHDFLREGEIVLTFDDGPWPKNTPAVLAALAAHCLSNGKMETVEYDPKDEIEKGISAVHWAVGGPTAPYFRFPALRQPPELIDYLGKRNIAIFSADLDSFDFKMRKPEQVRQSVMAKLKKHGKGIVLMHDFQHATAEAA